MFNPLGFLNNYMQENMGVFQSELQDSGYTPKGDKKEQKAFFGEDASPSAVANAAFDQGIVPALIGDIAPKNGLPALFQSREELGAGLRSILPQGMLGGYVGTGRPGSGTIPSPALDRIRNSRIFGDK